MDVIGCGRYSVSQTDVIRLLNTRETVVEEISNPNPIMSSRLDMASASSLLCEEQLQCSICLQPFVEPVTTPCGHNYCKSCIMGYWAGTNLPQCPLCKKKFHNKPQLQVNTVFRDMVEYFSSMKVENEEDVPAIPAKAEDVPCDVCDQPKLKAHKTCLGCLVSYCQLHLGQHQRASAFQKHQLVDPVSNLEDRLCKKHDKILELFCQTDQRCVCFMCLRDDHIMHETVPFEHAFRERKAWLVNEISEIKAMENTKKQIIKEIKSSTEQSMKGAEKEMADIAKTFTALVASLQQSQAELIQLIRQKQKVAKKQAEDHVTQLEQEVAQLWKRRSEMERLVQTDDQLPLLQKCSSLHFPVRTGDPFDFAHPFTWDPYDISHQSYLDMVKKAVAQMETTLNNEMEMLIHEVRLSDDCVSVHDGALNSSW